ncbi:MAG: site-specific integrase [Burkholderiales bacterium]|nr:site-specific integrase [Burkholderiales bacterium]
MARIERRGKRWRARVRVGGRDLSASFGTKAEAAAWATAQEAALASGKSGLAPPGARFGDLLRRYIDEVLPGHRGGRPEALRLEAVLRDEIASVRLSDLGPEHFAAWRDRRLLRVSGASVIREMTTLSSACAVAVREWRWLPENPLSRVRRPKEPAPRTRIYSDNEIAAVLQACGYEPDKQPLTQLARVGAAVIWSVETAMRAGEIVGLTWADVDLQRRVAHLAMTKNGSSRDVPLSTRALALLDQLRGTPGCDAMVFGIRNSASLDALWRKARDRAMLKDAHFHDLRATALTRMAKKLSVLELAKVSGHRDLRILSAVYYREDAANLADKLG